MGSSHVRRAFARFPSTAAAPAGELRGGEQMESIIAAVITGGLALAGTLAGSYFANRKNLALIQYRLEQLEEKVDRHNNIIARTYELEKRMELQAKELAVENHRIKDLERRAEQ